MTRVSASYKMNLRRIIVLISILFSVTGSNIAFFRIGGITVTPMRVLGVIALILSISDILTNHTIDLNGAYLLLLSIYALICSLIFSHDISQSISMLLDLLCVFGIVRMIVKEAVDEEILWQFIKAMLLAVSITIVISFYEYITGNHIAKTNYINGFTETWAIAYLAKAPTAFLYNPNNIGVLMIITMPLVLLCIRGNYSRIKSVWYYVLVVFMLAVILMTGSRGALISGMIIMMIYMLFSNIKTSHKVLLLIVAFILIYVLARDFIVNQLIYGGMFKNGALNIFAEGDGGRSYLAGIVINQVIKKHWLFGAGASGIEIITGRSAHNFILDMIGNFGIVGSLIFLQGPLSISKCIRYVPDKGCKICILLLLLAFVFVMFIPPVLETLHFVWISLALGYVYVRLKRIGEIS